MSSAVSEKPKSGIGRRTVTKGAAWSVPAVALAAKAPAAAVSDPCIHSGDYYVELYAPNANSTLANRPVPGANGFVTVNGCQMAGDPGCGTPVGTKTTLQGIQLRQTATNIIHHVTEGSANTGQLAFELDDDSCCIITGVKAHVHRFGAATGSNGSGDCPNPYCQGPGQYFTVTGLNSKTVTARPSGACGTGQNAELVHWGSPRWNSGGQGGAHGCTGSNQAQTGANSNGQPYGYVRLDLYCTGVNEPGPR